MLSPYQSHYVIDSVPNVRTLETMTLPGKIVKFVNCKLLRNHQIINDDLWVRDGVVLNPEELFYLERKQYDEIKDMNGSIVAPGFIDIQINGGFGIDFSHDLINNINGLEKVAKGILAHGVTSFCPTIVTSKPELYNKVLPLIKKHCGGHHGAEILGTHVEGPFINKEKKGAHSEADIIELVDGIETAKQVYKDFRGIKIVTVAPEKKNCFDVIKWLSENDIIVSIGHSMAEFPVALKAVKCGARLITHLFNAMLPFHHRDPGIVGLLGTASDKPIYYGVIADGIHTHASSLRIAYRAQPSGIVLVTDAISAMGLGDGNHHIGEKVIQIRDGQAFIANTNTLCGSIATMAKCVQYFKDAVGCSLVEALEAASLHPAQALKIDSKKGNLNYGCDADFVVLNDSLDVLSTWIKGECVYSMN